MGKTMQQTAAPFTMLRMVPLPRFAGEDFPSPLAATVILPSSQGRGTAGDGGGGCKACGASMERAA